MKVLQKDLNNFLDCIALDKIVNNLSQNEIQSSSDSFQLKFNKVDESCDRKPFVFGSAYRYK